MSPLARAAAFLGGAGLVVVGLWGALWVMLAAGTFARLPDPAAADGDPCCPRPDTWADVVAGGAAAIGLGALDAAVLAVGAALVRAAVSGRAVRAGGLWRAPAAVAGAIAAIFVGAIAVQWLADEHVDCGRYELRRADWESPDPRVRRLTERALVECDVLDGRDAADVRRLLGAEDRRTRTGRDVELVYGRVVVRVRDGRVADTTVRTDKDG